MFKIGDIVNWPACGEQWKIVGENATDYEVELVKADLSFRIKQVGEKVWHAKGNFARCTLITKPTRSYPGSVSTLIEKFDIGDKVVMREDFILNSQFHNNLEYWKDRPGIIEKKELGSSGGFVYVAQFEGIRVIIEDFQLYLYKSKVLSECECGNKQNPMGQGHSQWCKMFRQEF